MWVGGLNAGVSLHHRRQLLPLGSPDTEEGRGWDSWMLTLSSLFLQNEQRRRGDGPVLFLLLFLLHLRAPVEFSVSMENSASLGLVGLDWLGIGWERGLLGWQRLVLAACDSQTWSVL